VQKNLYLDGWNLILAMNAVMNITDGNSSQVGMYIGVMNLVKTFVEKFKPTKVFFVLDGPEAGERRRELYPNYKGKKRITARESKVQIMEGDDNMIYGDEGAFQNQLIQIYEFLTLLPITILSVPCCEADDMIAYLALKNKDSSENIIVSNDRDYLQLIQKNIKVYRWKAKRLYGENELINEFKITPRHFIYRKIMLGDTSDAIEGIKGIGEKTFENLSPIFLNEENNFSNVGELVEFFEHLNIDDFKTRERTAVKKIIEGKDKMKLLYQIMKLDESCMKPEQSEMLHQQIEEQKDKTFSRLASKIKIQKTNFNKLYEGFNDDRWLQPFAFLKQGIEIES
jgi:DNA polymerase-1